MGVFKSMRLHTQVSLAICIPCMLVSAFVTTGLTTLFVQTHRKEFQRRYQALGDQVASTLHELEVVTDMAGQAVLVAFKEREAQGKFNSIDDLRNFSQEMGVSAFYTYTSDGYTAFWTHPPANPQFVAFDICAEYADFFSGKIESEISPFVPVVNEPSIKFFKGMNSRRDQLVNVGIYSTFLDDLLKAAFLGNADVVDIDVRTPSGVSLRSGSYPTMPASNSIARFFSRTPSTVKDCCQCVQKGIAQSRDGYFYNVVVDVSLRPLEKTSSVARAVGLIAFVFSAAVSVLVARILATHFVSRIESIDRVATNVFRSGNLNVQVPKQLQDDEIGRLSVTFNAMLASLKEGHDKTVASERASSVAQHARQVAHDIRSPLAAIRMALSDLDHASEDTRSLLRSATFRIEDISNQLFEVNLSSDESKIKPKEEMRPVLLSSMLELIVSEKRTEYRQHLHVSVEFSVDGSSYGLFVAVVPSDFKRVISNLINNAVESLAGAGTVKIVAKKGDEEAIVEIIDDGCGMPTHILDKLGREEITHGKKEGHGIGVFSAQAILSRSKGQIRYTSEVGRGTCARVSLGLVEPPNWFLERLSLSVDCCVVIADDDLSIHRVWEERFRRSALAAKLTHVSSPKDLTLCVSDMGEICDVFYLVDYEFLGSPETGIDLIRKLGIAAKSVLVTSRFEENTVLAECHKLGLRMIPKSAAEHVPINCERPDCFADIDVIFVDDDRLIRKSWTMAARRAGLKMRAYAGENELMQDLAQYPLVTPIYVDFDLNGERTGLQVTERLAQKGFSQIFLATGFPSHAFTESTWLTGVIGKDAPF